MIASKRARMGGKRMDFATQRAALGQQQMTSALGIVRQFPGEQSHFEISTENGTNEILVDIELIPSGTRTLARVGFGTDGMYRIPRVGQEVAVLIPYDSSSLIKDSMDYEPIIIGVLDTDAPAELVDATTVIKAPSVIVIADHVQVKSPDIKLSQADGSGTDKLARKSDVDSVITRVNSFVTLFNTHVHSGVQTGGGISGASTSSATAIPTPAYSPNVTVK